MICTFYSYKGGVGRSMALANVAVWLSRKGLDVAMIDWDLEAPGLETFFIADESERASVLEQLGLVDLLSSYKKAFRKIVRRSPELDDQQAAQQAVESLGPVTHYATNLTEPGGNLSSASGQLFLITAGRRGEDFVDYANTVHEFDWTDFYASYEGEYFFSWLAGQIVPAEGARRGSPRSELADILLVDSRTGVTEMGGVSTRQLADVVVALSAPNLQNLEGVLKMAASFRREEIRDARGGDKPEVLLVPSRIDLSEIDSRDAFEERFREAELQFRPPALQRLGRSSWDLRIPYVPKFAYQEALTFNPGALKANVIEVEELQEAYESIGAHLAYMAPPKSRIRDECAPEIKKLESAARASSGDNRQGVYISFSRIDSAFALELQARLIKAIPDIGVIRRDVDELQGGFDWWVQVQGAIERSEFVLVVATETSLESEVTRREWQYARHVGVCVYPIRVPTSNPNFETLPNWIKKAHFYNLDTDWDVLVASLRSGCHAKKIPFMAPDLPVNFVARPHEFEQLLNLLLDDTGNNPVSVTTALSGGGGFGKTTLAAAVCHDERIQTAFDDGILWVTLGQEPNILGSLTTLYAALTGERPSFSKEEDAAHQLAQKLDDANCLLVIDDVWNGAHLQPFLRGGKRSARVVTSRIAGIAKEGHQVSVDGMQDDESTRLLSGSDGHEGEGLNRLADRLGNWPLMLELAQASIAERVSRGASRDEAVEYVNRAVDKRGFGFFRNMQAAERQQNIGNTLGLSLELLEDDERWRYIELAVFPEDTDVPLSALQALWGLDEFDAEELATKLDRFSLLRFHLNDGKVRLHDVIRTWLGEQVGDAAPLHQRLVDAWPDRSNLPDAYAWNWIVCHLEAAGRAEEARQLLLDPAYLRAKLAATDVQALITDYDYLAQDPGLKLIQSGLRLSAHVLYKEPAQLAAQLTARLSGAGSPEIQEFRAALAQTQTEPWFESHHPTFAQAGGALIRSFEGHSRPVYAVAVTPDGRHLVSGSSDNKLKLWDIETGSELRSFEGHSGYVRAVAVTPDGRHLVSGSDDNTLKLWDIETGSELRSFEGHSNSVSAVAVTPDGRHLVSGSDDETLKLWDIETGSEVRSFEGHSNSVSAVAVTPDGRHLVSGSEDETLKLWDIETGRELRSFEGHSDGVWAVALTPDGRHLVSGSSDKTLKLWDLETGSELRSFEGHSYAVRAVALTPDGRHLVSGSDDGTLKLWDLETGSELRSFEGHSGSVSAAAVTPDGRHLVSGSHDKTLRQWEVDTGSELRSFEGHGGNVQAVAVTPDGRHVVSGSSDHTLKLWEIETGSELRSFEGHSDGVWAAAVTPDGRHLVSGSDDKTLKLWDIETGSELRSFEGHGNSVDAVAVTLDGRHLVSGSDDNTLKLWDIETGSELRSFEGHRSFVYSVAVTPDGRHLVSGSFDNTLKLWDIETGSELNSFEGHGGNVQAVAVTPEGRHLVSGSDDETLKLWDIETGSELRSFEGPSSSVCAVAVTPDGRHLVSGSDDNTLKLWDLDTGRQLCSLSFDAPVLCCAVTPDSRTVLAGDAGGHVHFLRLHFP